MLRATSKIVSSIAAVSITVAAFTSVTAIAQEASLTAAAIEVSRQQPVPSLVRSQGILPEHAGEKLLLRFSIYENAQSHEPLWSEQQIVQVGARGEYSVLLGAGSAIGLPHTLFTTAEPRWLAVQVGEHEEKRTLLPSVPYALKSADAETVGGQPAASFVTHEELAAKLRATAAALTAEKLQPLATPTGGGTTGSIALWTSATVLGNSALTQTGTGATAKIGILTAAPAAALDVNGASIFRNRIALTSAAATAAAGVSSPALQLSGSSYSSGAAAAVAQNFVWQVQAVGNNTATPSSKLALLFAAGTAAPAATGLAVAPNGILSFAAKQTFPGAGTITGVTAGSGLKGGGTTGTVTLTVDPTKIPQLATANAFTKGASFGAESSFTGSSTDWMLVVTNTSASSKGTILGQAIGTNLGIEGASPGGVGVMGASDTGTGVKGVSNTTGTAVSGIANGSGPAGYFASNNTNQPAVTVSNATGTGISASSTAGYAGYFTNNGTFSATVYAVNTGTTGNAGYFTNNSASRVALAGVNSSTTATAIGVYGNVVNGNGVYGIAPAGNGVYGTSSTGTGVAGVVTGANATGVFGQATTGIGGLFKNNSAGDAGLAGFNYSTATTAVGSYGTASAGTGVAGVSTSGNGVSGNAPSGKGVLGSSQSGFGVYGASQTGIAILGELGFPSSELGAVQARSAIWGDAGDSTSYTPIGVIGTADDGGAGFFGNNSKNYVTLNVYNASGGSTHNFFRTFAASSPEGTCGIGGAGDLTCTGRVKSIVTTASARQVETYSVQSSENWLEDYGSGKLVGGRAVIALDASFVDTANTEMEYHVFLTPKGDAGALFVTNETGKSFEVRESARGVSSIAFDYRIVAKRRGMERQRLVDVTERIRAEIEQAQPKRGPGGNLK